MGIDSPILGIIAGMSRGVKGAGGWGVAPAGYLRATPAS